MERVLSQNSRQWWMGFSMIWIILFHLWEMKGGLKGYVGINFFDFFFSKGYLGVDIFFFLSAYGCACSFDKNSWKRFYKNRILRLFPIYAIYVYLLVSIYGHNFSHERWVVFLFQITGLSSLTWSHTHIEWYLPAQILVYAFFPLIYLLSRILQQKIKYFFVVILGLSLFAFLIDRVFISDFALRFPIIIFGAITFFIISRRNEKKILQFYLCGAVIAFLMIRNTTLACSLTIPLLLYSVSGCNMKLPFKKQISFIGKHSLEIYLAQNLALDHFMRYTSVTNIVLKFLLIALIITTGSFILHFVQRYSVKYINKVLSIMCH